MTRLLQAIGILPKPIDWNARLQASLRPDPQYMKRRRAGKLGWQRRKVS